ncbi:MAG: hypothetical protein IID09_06525 [Candidatus Hydrogenedentes bacterium]|nr:hypothetical protein [Candidatus Hydrogenedentota bacterium]
MRDILERLKIERRLAVLLFLSVLACVAMLQGLLRAPSPADNSAQFSTPGIGVPR